MEAPHIWYFRFASELRYFQETYVHTSSHASHTLSMIVMCISRREYCTICIHDAVPEIYM